MSPDYFKIRQCFLSLFFLNVPVKFEIILCHLSNLRKDHVALSNSRVRGHQGGGWGAGEGLLSLGWERGVGVDASRNLKSRFVKRV